MPLLAVAMFFCIACVSPVWASTDTDDAATVQKASQAFTRIAKVAIPTVVFIQVEQTITTSSTPFHYNNPFELFEDEMFRRFFGHRFPQMKPSKKYRQTGWGTGFIISKEGHILTNHHVVGKADKIEVRLEDGREFEAEIIGTDPKSDVALIKAKGAEDLPVLPLGNSEELEIGEWVMAIGNPFGLSHTLTVGVVSAKGRTSVGITDYEDFIQTDAAINPGNSGGPLINLRGEVVGINSAIFTKSGGYMGIGFAIPINMVKTIKEQLIVHGKVDRGYLGIGVQEVTPELASYFNLENTNGVIIAQIDENSPAEKSGLERGDVLLEMDGKPVKSVGHFRNIIALSIPGTEIELKVMRNNEIHSFQVSLGSLGATEDGLLLSKDATEKLGFVIQDLTNEISEQFGYKDLEGVLISNVRTGSPAAFSGLRPGMLIIEVNRLRVSSVADFDKAFQASRESKKLLLLVRERQFVRYVSFPIE
jgi:serine protease Do